MADLIALLRAFNAGRDPQCLALKYQRMRHDALAFTRGSCHLFYGAMPRKAPAKVPLVWACGDLHIENFGSYKGDNRQAYFDINDFDEAALAPATWDLARLLSSMLVAAPGLNLPPKDAAKLAQACVAAYARALATGHSRWVERDTATGLIGDLLKGLRERKRAAFIAARTEGPSQQRRLVIDHQKTFPVDAKQRARAEHIVAAVAAQQANPAFYEVLDVAWRAAGTGSLGLERYAALVRGKGAPDGHYLLDIKQSQPSSMLARLKVAQPAWPTEAHRVVALQQRMQAVPPAFLHAVKDGKRAYVLRALQPSDDRINLGSGRLQTADLVNLCETMGQLLAWAQLRSSGRQGAATADALVDFALRSKWQAELLAQAHDLSVQIQRDWGAYCQAYDDGALSSA